MIKITDILGLLNEGFKTHYYKDIKTYKVCELVKQSEESIPRPATYDGRGNYTFIQDDTNGLIIYHRIIDQLENEEDLELGFGRNSQTKETYTVKSVFFGQQPAIEDDNIEDINYYLAKEFKKLMPRTLDLADTNRIVVTGIEYNKEVVKEEEGVEYVPESILFSINSTITITGIEQCNTLTCN